MKRIYGQQRKKLVTYLSGILLILFLCITGYSKQIKESSHYTAIINGTIIDGTGKEPVMNGIILIEGNKVKAVGKAEDIVIPENAEIINARGKTIIPGIIDSHVHTAQDPAVRRGLLTGGVTSICDLGTPIENMEEFTQTYSGKEAVARGFRAGPIVTAPGGLPDAVLKEGLNYEVSTPEGVKRGVRDLLNKGADVIKIYLHPTTGGKAYPMLNEEEIRVLADETHKSGKLVRAHVTKLRLLEMAIDAGVDVIEHVPYPEVSAEIRKAFKKDDPRKEILNLMVVPEYDTLLPRMVEKGIIMVPTMDRAFGRYYFVKNKNAPIRAIAEAIIEIVRRFHNLGGTVALGTDYNYNSATAEGIPIREIEMMEAAGLTPMEIIVASTKHAAFVSGHGDELGTLEPGKLADMIILSGDPLADLKAMKNVFLVIKDGKIAYSGE